MLWVYFILLNPEITVHFFFLTLLGELDNKDCSYSLRSHSVCTRAYHMEP